METDTKRIERDVLASKVWIADWLMSRTAVTQLDQLLLDAEGVKVPSGIAPAVQLQILVAVNDERVARGLSPYQHLATWLARRAVQQYMQEAGEQ